jgi:hypothetical protein
VVVVYGGLGRGRGGSGFRLGVRLVRAVAGIDAAVTARHHIAVREFYEDGTEHLSRFTVHLTLAGLERLSQRQAAVPAPVRAVVEPTSMTRLALALAVEHAGTRHHDPVRKRRWGPVAPTTSAAGPTGNINGPEGQYRVASKNFKYSPDRADVERPRRPWTCWVRRCRTSVSMSFPRA